MARVVVGISGGVDSAVSAYLLQKAGYEVIGITFQFIDDFDASDSIKVCEKLGIEHHIVDYRDNFKTLVIDSFLNDYQNGLTPNPCVLCNKKVKINYLYQEMLKYNADYLATGHYASIKDGRLYKSTDLNKDQTYFLCEVNKEQLNHLLLPLEGIDKNKVRDIAVEIGLENANKKDSYDVCFIKSSFNEFISEHIMDNPGDIVDINSNKILGKHIGLSHYTIGQRKGLNIGGTIDRTFVVKKDIINNILYVSVGIDDALKSTSCVVTNVNWIGEFNSSCSAKFRYRQEETSVSLNLLDNGDVLVSYPNGVVGVTPGQACVFYLNNECLGGGFIKEVL